MLQNHHTVSDVELARLMDIAGTLRDITLSPRHYPRISAFLADALGLKSLAFAVIAHANPARRPSADGTHALTIASIASHRAPDADLHPQRADLPLRMLELAGQILQGVDDRALHAPALQTSACSNPACSCRHRVFHSPIDEGHLLLILLYEQQGRPAASPALICMLEQISVYLAKLIGAMMECMDNPKKLGKPFERLSPREWQVLCAMDSDDGEKQLAGKLGLSPHTLHTNIKTIYRKVGVGARLAALQKVAEARYEYRIKSILQTFAMSDAVAPPELQNSEPDVHAPSEVTPVSAPARPASAISNAGEETGVTSRG